MSDQYKQLYRSSDDRMISGVCGGLGEYFNIDPTIIRLIFVFGSFITGSFLFWVYIVMMFVVPEKTSASEAIVDAPITEVTDEDVPPSE
jgi:phage shock protein C